MKVYKIRDRNTGLFSTGGSYPNWEKMGKIWTREGDVRNSLTVFSRPNRYRTTTRAIPENWEVVCYNLVDSINTVPVSAIEFYKKSKDKQRA